MEKPQPGDLYRHYKNKLYRVIGTARHSETLEELVVYEALYHNDLGSLWVRPLGMFMEEIVIDGLRQRRFAPVEESRSS